MQILLVGLIHKFVWIGIESSRERVLESSRERERALESSRESSRERERERTLFEEDSC